MEAPTFDDDLLQLIGIDKHSNVGDFFVRLGVLQMLSSK